jgi:hypothetical protein
VVLLVVGTHLSFPSILIVCILKSRDVSRSWSSKRSVKYRFVSSWSELIFCIHQVGEVGAAEEDEVAQL